MNTLEIKNVTYSYANSKEKVLSLINQSFELGKFYALNLPAVLSRTNNQKSG